MSCGATKMLLVPPCPHPGEDLPRPARRSREFDPHNPPRRPKYDPRPPLPCLTNGCCACRPGPLPKKPMMANLKLRQLADCYGCRVSQECHNKKKMFYEKWQAYMDRMPRKPNTDYTVYCCDKYVDMGVNNDFFKYDRNLDLRKGPRTRALENFLFMKNVQKTHEEIQRPYHECAPYLIWNRYSRVPPDSPPDPMALQLEKSYRLRFEPALSRWYQLVARPEPYNFIRGTTIYKSRMRPFHKDSSFSTPIDSSTFFPTGNLSPFKELRDVKYNM